MPDHADCEPLDAPVPPVAVADGPNQVWPELFLASGPAHDEAVRRLRAVNDAIVGCRMTPDG
ncbi:MAG: hypothetical protein ABIP03_00910 [Aquihabitans sp.]